MSKRILVIENDQIHRQVLCEIAEGIGYEAVAVDRAMDGWRVLQEQTISLILLDIKMPRVHGHQFLRYIRSKGKITPVLIISGYLRREILEDLRSEERVVGILAKPFTVQRVAQEISRALEGGEPVAG